MAAQGLEGRRRVECGLLRAQKADHLQAHPAAPGPVVALGDPQPPAEALGRQRPLDGRDLGFAPVAVARWE